MSAASRASGKTSLQGQNCEVWRSYSGAGEDTSLLGCENVSFCEKFPTFGRNLVTSFSWSSSRRRMILLCLPVVSLRKSVEDRGFCSCHSEIRFTRKTL